MNKLPRAIWLVILTEFLVAACTPALPPTSSITTTPAPTQTKVRPHPALALARRLEGHPAVRRVRVAQFQSSPRPITRVVFDLASPIEYQVALDGDSVFVAFGGVVPAPVAVAAPAEAPRTSVFEAPAVPVVAEAKLPATAPQPAERHVVRAAAILSSPK